jgi:hypothetical protein
MPTVVAARSQGAVPGVRASTGVVGNTKRVLCGLGQQGQGEWSERSARCQARDFWGPLG